MLASQYRHHHPVVHKSYELAGVVQEPQDVGRLGYLEASHDIAMIIVTMTSIVRNCSKDSADENTMYTLGINIDHRQ